MRALAGLDVCLRHVGLFYKWGFPKIRGTFLGIPIIRTIVY